ncbi:MAG: DinB family protein [Bryobacteraceae bacterium]
MQLTEDERSYLLDLLRDSEAAYLGVVAGLSEQQWTYKPSVDMWSIAEIAQHVVVAEVGLFAKLQEALAAPPNPQWETLTARKAEFIENVMPVPKRKAQAPELLRPRNPWPRAEAIARFQKARARTIAFAAGTGLPLKQHTSEHPFPVFNTLNAHQWLLYIPLHHMRHTRQIEAVIATPGFPRILAASTE